MNSNKIKCKIISTGSKGNAVVLNDYLLVDCGVPLKALAPHLRNLRLVLLTHIHSDHFNSTTIRNLASERPTLRFGCAQWLARPLIDCGVEKHKIDILSLDMEYDYGICRITAVPLSHNVPNCGYKIHFANGKVFYATDTSSLNGIDVRNYDLYLVEANYDESEIAERIAGKKERGEYVYEFQAIKNHLSKAKCNDFIYRNIGANGQYIYLHCHEDREKQLKERGT